MADKLIAYYRVSTQQQGRSGLGLEAQQATVAALARQAGGVLVGEYTEIESGRRADRPQLAAALAHARTVRGSLVVAKLDRLARDAGFLLGLVDSGVAVAFGDLPDLTARDPITGRLVLTVLAAIAEFEGRRIGQRVREALAAHKARGGVLGAADPRCRGKLSRQQLRQRSQLARVARRRKAAEFRAGVRPVAAELLARGLTLRQAAAELNARGYTTRRGRPWTLATVDALMRRAEWEGAPDAL